MKLRVVFLHYHGFGHLNPCFPLASILQDEGYDVTFAGVEYFKDHVVSRGFSFYPLKSVPFGMGFEKWVNTIERKKYLYFSNLKDRYTDRLYKQRESSLTKLVNDVQPDVILLDGTQSTDFIVLYPHLENIRFGIVHAMFPTHVLQGRPPVNCGAFPEDEASVATAVRQLRSSRLKKRVIQKLTYLGFDDKYLIERRIRINKIPRSYCSDVLSLFNFQTRNITEFILAPREFDFPDFKVETWQHYIGFNHNNQSIVGHSAEYGRARDALKALRHTGTKVIYCSYGTVESEHIQTILSLIDKLVAIARKSGFGVMVAFKVSKEIAAVISSYEHFYLFDSVPQIDVLSYTDVFVSHGGLSSIKESIEAGVPMLMYPVHTDYDPVGNAARIEYHGLGLRGSAAEDTAEEIEVKLKLLLTEKRFIRNIAAFKKKNAAYTGKTFLEIFNRLERF